MFSDGNSFVVCHCQLFIFHTYMDRGGGHFFCFSYLYLSTEETHLQTNDILLHLYEMGLDHKLSQH